MEVAVSILLVWKAMNDDPALWWSRSEDGTSWQPQRHVDGAGGTSHGPALATIEGIDGVPGNVAMAWKGIGEDTQIWWSSWTEQGWTGQQPAGLGDLGTSHGPALGTRPDALVMAWKGMYDDTRMWNNTLSRNGWSGQEPILDSAANTSHGPALAGFPARQMAIAWKDQGNDPRVFTAFSDGRVWGDHAAADHGNFGTSDRPALAFFKGTLFMAWKGKGDDPRLFWSTVRAGIWAPQQLAGNGQFGSSHGPALGRIGDRLIMVWKGKGSDARLFVSVFDGRGWGEQRPIEGGAFGSSHGPALAQIHTFSL